MLDSAKLKLFLDQFCQSFDGEWLLAGGSLLMLFQQNFRPTEDIDIANRNEHPLSALNLKKLIELNKNLGLSVEQANSAVSFFVREFEGWNENLVLFKSTARCQFYRPNINLLIAMKLARGTDIDIEDCKQAMLCFPDDKIEPEKIKLWLKKYPTALRALALISI